MRILVLSAGRRNSLVKLFSDALSKVDGAVLVADADGLAPTAHMGLEAFQLPRVDAHGYEDALIQVVQENAVSAVIPTIDTELSTLHRMRETLATFGCNALVSEAELLNVAADKQRTSEVFAEAGFRVPRWWPVDENLVKSDLPEELFVKPRFGSASQGAQAVMRHQLPEVLETLDRPIIQERIESEEVTVDAYLDFHGQPLHYVPRRRLKTLGGESIQGLTLDDENVGGWLVELLQTLSSLGARGPVTIQYFETEGEPTLLEINPRFGGGFPLGHAAGALYPEWIVQALAGTPVEERLGKYQRGLYMTRSMIERFVEKPRW